MDPLPRTARRTRGPVLPQPARAGLLAGMWWLVATAAAGCSSAPADLEEPPASDALTVRLVDEGYVELDGRRMTVERMLYELRKAVRSASAAGEEPPWIDLRAPRDDRPPAGFEAALRRIQTEAYGAGIRHIEFSLEDA